MTESRTVTITDDEGGEDQFELPADAVDLLVPPDVETAEGIGDLVVISCAERIHSALHHAEGETDADLEAIESAMMDRFEERFGATFAEMTGHHH